MTEPDTDTIEPVESPAEAVPALIGEASHLWTQICGFYGLPQELYRRGFHFPRSHKLAMDWIRCLEILVRRIILIMALALDLPPRTSAPADQTRTRAPAPAKPFRPHRPVFVVMPPVPGPEPDRRGRGHARPLIRTWRTRALARRLDALFRAIRYPEAYARRTAFSLAHIATQKREPDRPLIGLHPWWIHPSKRTSGEDQMYEPIERAQRLAQHGLDAWHARLPVLGLPDPRPLEPG